MTNFTEILDAPLTAIVKRIKSGGNSPARVRLACALAGAMLLLVAASPLASAVPVKGSVTFQGVLQVASPAGDYGKFEGMYVADTSGLRALDVAAHSAHVTLTTWNSTEIQTPQGATNIVSPFPDQKSYDFDTPSLHLIEAGLGLLGAYPGEKPAALSIAANGETHLAPVDDGWIGTSAAQSKNDASSSPDVQFFSRVLPGPGILTNATGQLQVVGDTTLWLEGPTISIANAGGSQRIATGVTTTRDPLAPGTLHHTIRVAVVVLEKATLSLDSGSSVAALAHEATLSWHGSAVGYASEATLKTPANDYALSAPQVVELQGTIRSHFQPVPAGTGVAGLLDVTGDLSSTTLQAEAHAPLLSPSALPWIGAGVVAVLALAALAFGSVVVLRHRSPTLPEPVGDEEFEDPIGYFRKNVADAMSESRWEDALAYLSEFHRIMPANSRLMADEAFCHHKLGRAEQALALLAQAAQMSESAEFDYLAAVIAKEHGIEPDEIDALLDRALTREPAIAHQIIQDGTFQDHVGRARFDAALRRALQHVDK